MLSALLSRALVTMVGLAGLASLAGGACGGRTPLEDPRLPGNPGGPGGPGGGRDAGPGQDTLAPPFDGRDDGPTGFDARPDLPSDPPLDAPGPEGRWLRRTLAPYVQLEQLSCSFAGGQTGLVRAHVGLFDTCQRPGPLEIVEPLDPEAKRLLVRAWVWVEMGIDCPPTTKQFDRDSVLPALSPGQWTIVTEDGSSSAVISVGPPPPPVTCTDPGPAGASCLVDCDCQEGSCIGATADPVCATSRCGVPCEQDLDCRVGQVCQYDAGLAARRCIPRQNDACAGDADCPPGMGCVATGKGSGNGPGGTALDCDWTVPLGGGLRQPCADDSRCAAGLRCAEQPDGTRTCEVPCFTSGMRCPPVHVCQGGLASGRWVCEWIGD